MAITLERIRGRNDTLLVPMNEVKSGRWSSSLQFLATEGLNGCTAVAVMSENAGILAHIAPRTIITPGDQNVRLLMQQVINHFNLGRQYGLFPPASGIILAAVYEGMVALPEARAVIQAVLDRLGVSIQYEEYHVRKQDQARARGETSFIIHGGNGAKPQMYINDSRL